MRRKSFRGWVAFKGGSLRRRGPYSGRLINTLQGIFMSRYSKKQLAGFIVPSVIGILLFMVPINVNGSWTITIKLIADAISLTFWDFLPLLCVIIITISAVLGVITLGSPSFVTSYPLVSEVFSATPAWAIIRILGAIFVWITYLQLGADGSNILGYISSPDTGGFVLNELLTVLVVIFLLAGLLLPLLLDFGLLEFIGALLTKFILNNNIYNCDLLRLVNQ